MKSLSPSKRSLKHVLFYCWALIALISIASAVIAYSAFYSIERQNRVRSTREILKTKFERIRGSLYRQMIGSSDLNDPLVHEIAEELKSQLEIDRILINHTPPCRAQGHEICFANQGPFITASGEFGLDGLVLTLFKENTQIGFYPFFIAIAVVSLTLFSGLLLQWKLLKKHILDPALVLVESVRADSPQLKPDTGPQEFFELSKKLKALLLERDNAIREATLQEGLAIQEAEYASFAHSLLHSIKSPLLHCMATVRNDHQINQESRKTIIELLDRPHTWIQSAMKEFLSSKHSSANPSAVSTPHSAISTLGAAIQSLHADLSTLASSAGIQFQMNVPPPVLIKFCGLTSQDLYRCISNLVTNAFEAVESATNKNVVVKCYLNSTEERECCEIVIKDYGICFDPQALKAFNEHSSYTTKLFGSGFGLLDTRKILEKVGGSLTVLPFDDYKIVKLVIPIVAQPDWIYDIRSIQRRILILDDDPRILEFVKNSLYSFDAANASSGILYFSEEEPFLLEAAKDPESFLLVDYDYQGPRNGIQLITEERLQDRAVLLSGLIPLDSTLVRTARTQEIKVYPKESLHWQ